MVKKASAVRQAKRPVHRRGTRVTAIVGVSLLALVAAGLSAYALLGDRDGSNRTAPSQPVAPVPTETVTPTPTDAPESTPTATTEVSVPQRLLAVGEEAGNLIRATIGACDASPGTLEVTFDGGDSWQAASFTDASPTEFRQIDMADASALQLSALDESCDPLTLSSFVGGVDWAPEVGGAAPMSLPEAPSTVVDTSTGQVDLPCTAVSLAASGARGIALCDDASVSMTQDSGASWSAVTPVPATVAVGVTPNEFFAASAGEDACDGIRTRTISESSVGDPGGCLTDAKAADGAIAVAGGTSALFVWAGDRFAVSADGGTSWS